MAERSDTRSDTQGDINDYDLLIITTDSTQPNGFIQMSDTLTADSVVLKGYNFKIFGGPAGSLGMISVHIPWLNTSTLSPQENSNALLLPVDNSVSGGSLNMNMRIRLPTRTSIQKSFPVNVGGVDYVAGNGPQAVNMYSNTKWSLTLYFEVQHSHLFM